MKLNFNQLPLMCFIVVQQAKQSIAAECTRKCSVVNSKADCWDQSLEYFTEELANALDKYAGTLMLINRWRHKQDGDAYKDFEDLHLNKTLETLFESDGESRIIPKDSLRDIIKFSMTKIAPLQEEAADEAYIVPGFRCPVPCGYEGGLWIILFWVMFAITVLVVITVALYIMLFKDNVVMVKRKHRF